MEQSPDGRPERPNTVSGLIAKREDLVRHRKGLEAEIPKARAPMTSAQPTDAWLQDGNPRPGRGASCGMRDFSRGMREAVVT